jgi:flagellar biogenesis protein FliO
MLVRVVALLLVCLPLAASAQQPGVPAQPQFTPLAVRQASAQEAIDLQAKPALRLAPKSTSSRQPLARPAAASPGRALGTVAGSLGLVLGLFLVVSWCLQRTSPKRGQRLPKEAVELLGQAPLTVRQQMQLVRVGSKLLLLALSPAGAETLTEITEPAEVEHLLALCRKTQPGSASVTFQQTLSQLATSRGAR